jgi:hypothetical protein
MFLARLTFALSLLRCAVQGLWGSGHFREAIGVAAKAVNAHCQAKVGRRDLVEGKLFSDVFASKPPADGRPRLRLMDDDGSPTYRSRHDGAAEFARGLYTAIRNPHAHELVDELPENEALEQVAAFSILARWVDNAVVETADPAPASSPNNHFCKLSAADRSAT